MKHAFKQLTIVATLTAMTFISSLSHAATVADMQPSEITVTGNAQRTMAPTYAILSLGLTSSSANVTAAKSANDKVMSQLINSLSSQGLAKKDIYSSNISVNPDYNYDNGNRTITSYSISNTVTVRINNLDKVSSIIGAAVQAGATEINSLTFKADVPHALQDQLTVDAIKDGRHNAEIMASALGRTLGPVKTVSTNQVSTNSIDTMPRLAKVGAELSLSTNTPVEQGSLIVSQDANMTYYLQ